MKLTTSVIILALVASASAQQKPTDKPLPVKSGTVNLAVPTKAPAPKPAAAQTKAATTQPATAPAVKTTAPAKAPAVAVKTAPAPAKPTVAVKPAVKKIHKAAPKTETKVAATPAVKPADKPAEPESEKAKRVASIDHSKRDPFQTVIRERSAGGPCASGGKQCLVPDEVALKGVVRSNGSIIAVVTTKDNRAYFLRENDPVLNGVVTRITEGSITFREKTTDIFGKSSMREVVKKINPTAV
jgi:Tfp pilus assembly protein PilP